ncbi:unnamed protein product [Caenorhabditis angaria]|uniref:Uncharacterized protein n=1 Tax=Caenorhabditis angaria TaxID=860376 RepID=A0A9P1N115_9PELO|nr:unnamed protein product [Caenorhabditis angaria]
MKILIFLIFLAFKVGLTYSKPERTCFEDNEFCGAELEIRKKWVNWRNSPNSTGKLDILAPDFIFMKIDSVDELERTSDKNSFLRRFRRPMYTVVLKNVKFGVARNPDDGNQTLAIVEEIQNKLSFEYLYLMVRKREESGEFAISEAVWDIDGELDLDKFRYFKLK